MDPIRRIDLDRLPELREALTAWLAHARKAFRLEKVYLFGSFARGTPHEDSDIDLVLIGPFEGKMPYRITSVLMTTELPIEPLCYTPQEWQAMIDEEKPFALEVLRSYSNLIVTV